MEDALELCDKLQYTHLISFDAEFQFGRGNESFPPSWSGAAPCQRMALEMVCIVSLLEMPWSVKSLVAMETFQTQNSQVDHPTFSGVAPQLPPPNSVRVEATSNEHLIARGNLLHRS